MEEKLSQKHCIPCCGSVPPLDEEGANLLLKKIHPNWRINDLGHLVIKFKFDDYAQALAFAIKVSEVAEMEGHHPEILLGWGKCEIEIWTHKIDGLTESDFILAAIIDTLK